MVGSLRVLRFPLSNDLVDRSETELWERRRRIRFTRSQEGRTIGIVFRPILRSGLREAKRDPYSVVVNCVRLNLPVCLTDLPKSRKKNAMKLDLAQLVRGPCATESYITGVDLLRIFQFIVNPAGGEFSAYERRTLRRTIDTFHYFTLKKDVIHQEGLGQHIVSWLAEMPEPRPISIAKDLKIFRWSVVENAIEKLTAKFVSASNTGRPISETNVLYNAVV